jgi:hypothetical protein
MLQYVCIKCITNHYRETVKKDPCHYYMNGLTFSEGNRKIHFEICAYPVNAIHCRYSGCHSLAYRSQYNL